MSTAAETSGVRADRKPPAVAWLAWIWVGVPFLYGLYKLVERIPALFGG